MPAYFPQIHWKERVCVSARLAYSAYLYMKVAVIGSRSLQCDLEHYIPAGATLIISGGARGIDRCAAAYAASHGIPIKEYRPQYALYGKAAPIRRNIEIIKEADLVLAFWDGQSKGTAFVIRECRRRGKHVKIFYLKK